MSDPKKPKKDQDAVDAMLSSALDRVPSVEEAEAELREDGVDVAAFLAGLDAKLKPYRDAARLSALNAARRAVMEDRQRPTTRSPSKYSTMDRAALRKEVEQRGLAGVHFNKLQELTDDDLRTWLEDDDDLQGR